MKRLTDLQGKINVYFFMVSLLSNLLQQPGGKTNDTSISKNKTNHEAIFQYSFIKLQYFEKNYKLLKNYNFSNAINVITSITMMIITNFFMEG